MEIKVEVGKFAKLSNIYVRVRVESLSVEPSSSPLAEHCQ